MGESPSTLGGEQPLPPYGSCNLGSINLALMVKNPYTSKAKVDWTELERVTKLAVRFLDDVIDANQYPLPQIAEKALRDRRIGLGVMGWAEMLVQMALPYDSEEAVALAEEVMSFIKAKAVEASMELAEERGPYPEWEGSQWQKAGLKVRNATLTTIAPTGTISLLAARPDMPVSGGIEPKFALVFQRNQAGEIMLDVDGQFETVARQEGWYSEDLMRKVAENNGSCRGIEEVPEKWRHIFKTANEIGYEWHVRMQAAFQGDNSTDVLTAPVDAAVSKTINFANSATVEDVRNAYELAYKLGLKGITVYRDGSRSGQVLTAGKSEEKGKVEAKSEIKDAPVSSAEKPVQGPTLRKRPLEATGRMFLVKTHFGNLTLDVHMDEQGEPFEVIVNVGAVGSDLMADAVAMGMLISKMLRLRSDVSVMNRIAIIIDTLKGIGGSGSYGFGPNRVTSLASAIATGLQRFQDWYYAEKARSAEEEVPPVSDEDYVADYEEMEHIPDDPDTSVPTGSEKELCPDCGNYTVIRRQGCKECLNCGWNACS